MDCRERGREREASGSRLENGWYAEGASWNMPAVRVQLFRKERRSLRSSRQRSGVLAYYDHSCRYTPLGKWRFSGSDTLSQAEALDSAGLGRGGSVAGRNGALTRVEKYDPHPVRSCFRER